MSDPSPEPLAVDFDPTEPAPPTAAPRHRVVVRGVAVDDETPGVAGGPQLAERMRRPTVRALDISVVIATARRPELLRRCVLALLAQTLDPSRFEIVIVDDGHTDDTRYTVAQLMQQADGKPAIRFFRSQGTRGPAGARNVGWRAAHAPVIAFTDDDTLPERDWLEQGLKALTPELSAAAGRIVVPMPNPPTDHAKTTHGLESAEFATANAFVWRRALEAVGGFDARFQRAWREDSDLHFSLLKQVGPVGWAAGAVVVHPVREAPFGISLRNQANVYFDALLYKKHPLLYRTRIRSAPPWRYFVIVGCALAALVAGLAHAPWIALLFGAAAVAGIAAFARQRLRDTARTPRHVAEMVMTSAAIPFAAVFWRVAGALRFRTLFP